MTAVPNAAVRERLRDVARDAVGLNQRLEEMIAVPTSKRSGGSPLGKADRSRPPWNSAAAHLILNLHTESRSWEATLRAHLNMGSKVRGAADANTVYALDSILNLAESSEDSVVVECARWLNAWCSRALVVLGDHELPQHLPRNVGESEPRCPYCDRLTLRFWPIRGEVRCVNPECHDESKRRPVARMDYSPVVQDWVLAWRDGSVGVPTPDSTSQRIA